jgi:hypothetical protein
MTFIQLINKPKEGLGVGRIYNIKDLVYPLQHTTHSDGDPLMLSSLSFLDNIHIYFRSITMNCL